MPDLAARTAVLLAVVAVYTVVTAIFDHRQRRIPNFVTVPMFLVGWIYQLAFAGWAGLADGGLGFLIGFGSLLVLWLIGGAGGGDVKLLGGLSVWLGFALTRDVLMASILFVVLGSVGALGWSMIRRGTEGMKRDHLAAGRKSRKERRVMAYAIPVALSTWAVLIIRWPNLY